MLGFGIEQKSVEEHNIITIVESGELISPVREARGGSPLVNARYLRTSVR